MSTYIKDKIREQNTAELDAMLNSARSEERCNGAEIISSHLNILAWKISRNEMSHTEAAELLRVEAEKFQKIAWGTVE